MQQSLHGDDAKSIQDTGDQNDDGHERAKPLDHEAEDLLTMELAFVVGYFLLDCIYSNNLGNQDAGSKRCNRHHNRIGQEIKEVQEIHSDDGHTGQRSESESRQASENNYNDNMMRVQVLLFQWN